MWADPNPMDGDMDEEAMRPEQSPVEEEADYGHEDEEP